MDAADLIAAGLDPHGAHVATSLDDPAAAWSAAVPFLPPDDFSVHQRVFDVVYGHEFDAPPTWTPARSDRESNLASMMRERDVSDFAAFHRWTVDEPSEFWMAIADRLGVVFSTPPEAGLDPASSVETPRWFSGARLNITDSCFTGSRDRPAIVFRRQGAIDEMSLADLETHVNRFAGGLRALGLEPGARIAIAMTMNVESVIAYLGTVRAGGTVVSIADSFAADQIAKRLAIAGASAVVTEFEIERLGKTLPMYTKIVDAAAPTTIVLGAGEGLREGDIEWHEFLGHGEFETHDADPAEPTNVLFSSGTTGDPKAITWDHTTPLKAAMDGHFHQDIQPGDVVCWPTNLGWMMGPWLIYASLLNGATIALFDDAPTITEFGAFVEHAGVTMLGVVPSLVRSWRSQGWLGRFDWSKVRVASSTGEPSNRHDMLYLSAMLGHRPIIEYCGGTEIGGGYIAGSPVHASSPATFATPTLGWDLVLLDEDGNEADSGEVFLIPPSLGMSTKLLNRDHHEVYYEGTPTSRGRTLRRHGDHMERLSGGYYRALGRVDDTMNLGGIKVSSAEIERALEGLVGLVAAAAVAVAPEDGGPERLVIFAELAPEADDPEMLESMRSRVRATLNPLFKIDRLVRVESLPRTASNKIMRRSLRDLV